MVVNSTVSEDDRRFSKACELYKAAGYGLRDSQAFEEIHCQKDSCSWLSNGFLQCFTSVEGKRARVLVYFPSQELQPHKHDIDEEFLITHGAVDLWTWPQKSMKEDSSQEDGVHMCHQRLTKGSRFGVPAGMVHCLRADSVQGLVFHELVAEDSFQKRSTEFMDKKLQKMPSVYTDKLVLITGANRGLGLGFAKAFAVAGAKVIACCRDPSKADDLAALTPKPLIVPLDIANEASVKELPSILSSFGITSLDYLVNNAGISSPNHPNDPIVTAEAEIMKSVFNVNVMGTIMVTQTCLPLLEAASTKCVVVAIGGA
jgi:quercetin dioxygenase-like cupin family protein